MVPAIIQARMSSSRLPGKVLRTLGNDSVLGHVIRHVCRAGLQPVVCTSDLPSDDAISEHCSSREVVCVRGPLEDVVQRFALTLQHPDVVAADWFYRVTADCPLLSATLCDILWQSRDAETDFLGIDQTSVPAGISAELIRRSSFERFANSELTKAEREHVTLFMYEHPDLFKCRRMTPPLSLANPNLRLTLDTADDYALLSKLFQSNPKLTAQDAIQLVQATQREQPHVL